MSSQLRLKCPGCQVTLQLKGELRGKEAWFGRQISDIRESLNPSPGQYGMICYSNGLACCGFAWVER